MCEPWRVRASSWESWRLGARPRSVAAVPGGPNGAGVDAGTGYPVAFSPTKDVVWKAAVPYAQSSPVVAGSHVYVTARRAISS